MIKFGYFSSISSRDWINKADKILSFVLIVHSKTECNLVDLLIQRVADYPDSLELILALDPGSSAVDFPTAWIMQIKAKGCRVIQHGFSSGIPAVYFDEGILVSRGKWLCFIDAAQPFPDWDSKQLLDAIQLNPAPRLWIGIHPQEEDLLSSPPEVMVPWMDLLYQGFRFPFQNIFFQRDLFTQVGLFDPHIALKDCFQQDFLIKVCRLNEFGKLISNKAVKGIELIHFPPWLSSWMDVDRSSYLRIEQIANFSVDDLAGYRGLIPDRELWLAYLNRILPYYSQYRPSLPPGYPEFVQSYPPDQRFIQLLKLNYETRLEAGFRNYDVFTQGIRSFKLSFIQYQQYENSASSEAIILLSTAKKEYLDTATQVIQSRVPVGYAVDGDLLNQLPYRLGMDDFSPEHSVNDEMVQTIKEADIVFCSGTGVKQAVENHNLRTIQYEGSLPQQYLPETVTKKKGPPFKFGYIGGRYQAEEIKSIWPTIERICLEYGDEVRFEFWVFDQEMVPNPLTQVSFHPLMNVYDDYLSMLARSCFDAMLVPQFSIAPSQHGNLPDRLCETVAADAVGLYADIPSYSIIQSNDLGLIVQDNPEAWYQAIRTILEMPDDEYSSVKQRGWNFVREFFLTPAILPVHEAGLEALFFHGHTRESRGEDGRPVVMYVFPAISGTGGGEIAFRRRIDMAMSAGIRPFAVVPEYYQGTPDWKNFLKYLADRKIPCEMTRFRIFLLDPPKHDYLPLQEEERNVRSLLTRHKVALVHSGGYAPAIGKICAELGIPHVMSHFQVKEDYSWAYGDLPFKQCDLVLSDSIRYARKWADLLRTDWAVLRDPAPGDLFDAGFRRLFGDDSKAVYPGKPVNIGIIGSVMPRKSQLEAIKAIGILRTKGYDVTLDIYGSTKAHPDYVKRCREGITSNHISDRVIFHGFANDIREIYDRINLILTVSSVESFPTVIKEGMSIGILVVTSQAGGITELIKDGINGIITDGIQPEQIADALERAIHLTLEDSLRIRRNAFRMAIQEFHPRRSLLDLLAAYNRALRVHQDQNLAHKSTGTRKSIRQEVLLDNPANIPSSTRRIGRVTQYSFTPSENRWIGFQVMVGTHTRQLTGTLELLIFSPGGSLLRKATQKLEEMIDNDWTEFRFAPIEDSKGQLFTLKFVLSEPGEISFYEGNPMPSLPAKAFRKLIAKSGFMVRGSNLQCRGVYENPNP